MRVEQMTVPQNCGHFFTQEVVGSCSFLLDRVIWGNVGSIIGLAFQHWSDPLEDTFCMEFVRPPCVYPSLLLFLKKYILVG